MYNVLNVYNLFLKPPFFFSFNVNIAVWQSHMNKDHGEDTKAIVQHWTSVPVCHLARYTIYSVSKKSDSISTINIMESFFVKPVFNMISLCISGHKKKISIWMAFWLSCILHYCFIYDINAWKKYDVEKANLNKIVWSGKNV
jgi:hypothetical protein